MFFTSYLWSNARSFINFKVLFLLLSIVFPVSAEASTAIDNSVQPNIAKDLARYRNAINSYILGAGDAVYIEINDLEELSGRFSVGPDGFIYLPRLRDVYVEGLTIGELQNQITKLYTNFIIAPQVYIRPVAYKPVRVYIGGEVKRPGYYTLAGLQDLQISNAPSSNLTDNDLSPKSTLSLFPTVFDAIKAAEGITPYSDLSNVKVVRRQPNNLGGGRIESKLNFMSLLTDGNESQNIRLFHGDIVNVAKSPVVLRDQLLKAGQTNLTPQFFQVYVSGRVENVGAVTLPQGSSLVQAIDLAGGTKVLHGKVEFIRFTREGEIDRRIFGFRSDAPLGDYRNPVLVGGDVIRLRETALTKSLAVFNEVTTPAIGIYSIYSLFDGFSN